MSQFSGIRTRSCFHKRSLLVVLLGLISINPSDASQSTPVPVSFRNEVMAVLSKAGCNAGTCHGNANGKAGFKLSLRGEDPAADWKALTRDQSARRTNPMEPDQSLLLLKSTAEIAHEGGKRFSRDSMEYQLLRKWISAGAPVDPADTPRLEKLEVSPREKVVQLPNEVQVEVIAWFSNGAHKKINDLAVFETANPAINVTPSGKVSAAGAAESTVLVRFLDRQEPVRLAFVPDRPGFKWQPGTPRNFIDERIFSKLRTVQVNPSALCGDEVFLRRGYLDLLGLLPTAVEAKTFVASHDPQKRSRLIDALLLRPEFADHWALKWSDLLRNEERALDQKGIQAFHRWIRQSIADGKPLDQFARELIAARGSTYLNPAANFYRANRDPISRAEAAAQVFLGTRLQCAQCHNHPFDRWTQDDYYNWGALFARVQYKILENRRQDDNDKHEFKGEQVVYLARKGEIKNPRTGKPAQPRLLAGEAVEIRSEGPDELEQMAQWLTTNRLFARVQANRIWYHLLGKGIVDPIDDFRPTNPPTNPALLEQLSDFFIQKKYDLRSLIRLIMNSATYQLSSEPNETNAEDEINFSHAYVRRLSAEQLLDCQSQVAGVSGDFTGYPLGFRSAQLPGARAEKRRGKKSTGEDQFLEMFGKPPRLLTCECERSTETTMGQAFQMLSGPAVNELLTDPTNRLHQWVAAGKTPTELVDEIYWAALSRAPSRKEKEKTEQHLKESSDTRQALEDVAWALFNAKEFILRR